MLILLCVLVTAALGVAFTRYVRPTYEATSVVRFEVDRVDLQQLVQSLASENMISTELELLQGRSAALAVVDSLGLRAQPIAPRRGGRTEIFSVLSVLPSADCGNLVFRAKDANAFSITGSDSTVSLGSVRIGDTVRVAGIVVALTPAARGLRELRLRVDLPDDAIQRFRSGLKVSRPPHN